MEKKTKRIKIKKDGGNVRADGVRVAGCVTETKPTGATATNQNVLRKTQGALVITRAGFAPLHRPSSSARQPWPANDIGHKYNRDRATEYYIHYDRGRPSQPFRPPAPPRVPTTAGGRQQALRKIDCSRNIPLSISHGRPSRGSSGLDHRFGTEQIKEIPWRTSAEYGFISKKNTRTVGATHSHVLHGNECDE